MFVVGGENEREATGDRCVYVDGAANREFGVCTGPWVGV
jgi:hypothetical protein